MDLNETVLGIEFGSTRIKAVLLNNYHKPIAAGEYEWENKLFDGIWTYAIEDAVLGLQACFKALKDNVKKQYNLELTTLGAIGISGMMHGYLPVDKNGNLLTAFRSWRNTITKEAAEALTQAFNYNIPQRWSIAHLYQAILNQESHLPRLSKLMTLSVYVHWLLTGQFVIGLNEASGMFPICRKTLNYNAEMMCQFDDLIKPNDFPWHLKEVLPKLLKAGEIGGTLTPEGALLLDPSGILKPGIPMAPPEGDAGTGMVATNAIKAGTGNVSAGTSDFAMIVVDKDIAPHTEIDMVTTPAGKTVAMVHCNNCTSDINAWTELFYEFAQAIKPDISIKEIYTLLFNKAMEGEPNCGGLLSYNYISGEGITNLNDGRPIFTRKPNSRFSLANFMRTHLYSALATLKIGMDILTEAEGINISNLYAHGGFFKTPEVGQYILSAAVDCPISVLESAGEGGPYGMALLAAYMLWREPGEELEAYLENKVFSEVKMSTLTASRDDVKGFSDFVQTYKNALPIEKEAIFCL